jgi:hypothetical protein
LATKGERATRLRQEATTITTTGSVVQATVTLHSSTDAYGNETAYHFVFAWTTESGTVQVPIDIEVPHILNEYLFRFNHRALAAFVRQRCDPSRPQRWFEYSVTIPCTRTGIVIHYLPDQPERLVVPDFPPRPGLRDRVREWWAVGMLVISTIVFAGLVFSPGLLLFRLFLGMARTD